MIECVFCTDLTDQEADYTKSSSLPPTELEVGGADNPAIQIACGQHHTGREYNKHLYSQESLKGVPIYDHDEKKSFLHLCPGLDYLWSLFCVCLALGLFIDHFC